MKKEDLEKIYKDFLLDRDAPHRIKWMKASADSRCFMNNDLSPLEADGLIKRNDKDNPVVEKCDIPEKVRFLQGRVFSNDYEPEVKPYEGDTMDEEHRMIAQAVFRHERSDRRDCAQYNLNEEIDKSVRNALVDGMGYLYEAADETLRDELFYLGKPVYIAPDPHDVSLDRTARRLDEVKHVHFIRERLTKDEFKEKYPDTDIGKVKIDWYDKLRDTEEQVVPIVESQYLRIEWLSQYALNSEDQQRFGWDSKFAEVKEFRAHLKELKKTSPQDFQDIDIAAYVKTLPKLRTKNWHVESVVWAAGLDKPLEDERDIGKSFSIFILDLIDVFDQPYAFGVPYFLRSLQILATIARTIQARTILRMDNPGGLYREGTISPEELEELEENIIGKWIGLKFFEGGLKDNILPREVSPYLQFLQNFIEENKDEMNAVFATWREQLGQAGFAGQSGKMAQTMLATGSYSFTRFAKKLEVYLEKIYGMVLRLASAVIPRSTLLIIAGEDDEKRKVAITKQTYYERIQRVNVRVELDTRSEADKSAFKGIVQALLIGDKMAPASAFRELNFKEPTKLAEEIDAWMARRSKAEYYAKRIEQVPELGDVLDGAIQEFDKNYLNAG